MIKLVNPARSRFNKGAPFAAALLLVAGFSGCLSVRREFAAETTRQHAAWSDLTSLSRARAPRTFTWEEALEQLRAANPKVRGAELELVRAREARDQVRRSLIPLVSLQTGYNRTLGESTNAGFDPFYFAATVFFDVPGLMNFRTRSEAAVLTLTRAELARDAVWRGQVVALYRAASADAVLAQHARELDRAQTRARALAPAAPRAAAFARQRLTPAQTRLTTQRDDAQAKLADLLGLPGTPIAFRGDLPPPGYADAAARPAPQQLAALPLRLAALDLVALRARQLGVRLQAWPELNVSVSTPTLYRRAQGQNDYWSSHEVLVGANAFWTLDTQGRQASQSRILDAELALRRQVLTQEAHRVAAQLRTALDRLQATDAEFASVEAALRHPPARVRGDLVARRDALAAERREWQTVLWFFDDSRWISPAPTTTAPALAANTR